MPAYSSLPADGYFMRRLAEVRQLAASLPASVQFDIARLPYGDQQIAAVVEAFGAEEKPAMGFADIFEDLVSAEPRKIPVADIKALQENLRQQGYLPDTYSPSGVWDDESYVAFRRMDRDAYEQMKSGKRWGSAPLEAGVRMLTNTLPPNVFQGIVGIARGVAEQAPETLTRLGLVGGAVVGGGIGAQIAGPPGALVGAGVGAVTGFFADLLTDQPGEEDQGIVAGLVDALSPYEEYWGQQKGGQAGLANFFEDLDFVMVAGSAVGGAKWGMKAVGAGQQAFAQSRAAGMTAGQALMTRTPASIEAAAGAPTAIMNALESWPRTQNMGWVKKFAPWVKGHSLSGRPLFQMTNGMFTGLSTATIGARLFAGFDFGTGILDENGEVIVERDPFTGELTGETTKGTKMERAMAEAPLPQTGVNIPVIQDVAYLSAFLLQPMRFFPWKAKAIASGTERLMGDYRLLMPTVHALQHETPNLSAKAARTIAREQIFGGPDGAMLYTWRWADWAITRKALMRMGELGENLSVKDFVGFKRTRHQIIRTIREEATETGHSPTLTKAIVEAMEHPETFEASLILANGRGSGLLNMRRWREAVDYLHDLEVEVKNKMYVELAGPEGQTGRMVSYRPIEEVRPKAGPVVKPGKTVISQLDGEEVKLYTPSVRTGVDEAEILRLETDVKHLNEQIKTQESILRRLANPGDRGKVRARLTELVEQRDEIKAQLKSMKKGAELHTINPEDMRLSLMRLDEFAKEDYQKAARWLMSMKKVYYKNIHGSPAEQKWAEDALRIMNNKIDELAGMGYISPQVHMAVKNSPRGISQAVRELQGQSRVAARYVELPAKHVEHLRKLGYKAVWTGEDMLYPYDMKSMIGLIDLPEYNRIGGFIETMGMSPAIKLEEDLFKLRHAYEVTALDEALRKVEKELGISHKLANGNEVLYHLSRYMRNHNMAGATHGPLVFEKGGPIHMYRVDSRQLQPRHIEQALGKVIPGITPDAAKQIYGALRTGSAWGNVDFRFLHPVASARAMGRALQLNGLPGYADLIRSWHSQERYLLDPVKVLYGKAKYRPTADLALSIERARFAEQMGNVTQRLKLTQGEAEHAQMAYDVLYRVLHKMAPDAFPTPDVFYKTLSAEYLRSIADVPEASGLWKMRWNQPRMKTLIKLADKYAKAGEQWYPHCGDAVRGLYAGTKVTLRTGQNIDADELMFRVLAVTSGGEWPKTNVTKAIKAMNEYLENPYRVTFTGIRDSDTLSKVFDGWVPDTPKYGPYYRAIRGDDQAIVLDRRMEEIFGFSRHTPSEARYMEQQIRALADRLGTSPASAQAALWVGYADHMENMAKYWVGHDPEMAKEFRRLAEWVRRDPTGDFGYDMYLGKTHLRKADAAEFAAARPKEPTLTAYSPEELQERGVRLYLTEEGTGGFGIAPDGEIVNLWAARGAGREVLAEAIHRGGRRITFYDVGGLGDFYKTMKFVERKRVPFDPAKGVKGIEGAPDYVEAELRAIPGTPFGRSREAALELRQAIRRVGATKVADPDGNPLRVYHGGPDDIGSYFIEGHANDDGVIAWFSDSPHVANEWAISKGTRDLHHREMLEGKARAHAMGLMPNYGDSPQVTGAYLDIRNPIVRSGAEDTWVSREQVDKMIEWAEGDVARARAELDEILEETGMSLEEYSDWADEALMRRNFFIGPDLMSQDPLWALKEAENFRAHLVTAREIHSGRLGVKVDWLIPDDVTVGRSMRSALEEAGFDGIIYKDVEVHTFHFAEDHTPPLDAHSCYIPFREEQIHTGFFQPGAAEQARALARTNMRPEGLLRMVEGRVLGQLEYGGEFGTIVRAFQEGDFSTLVHEAAHLLRISLPESELVKVEAMLGIRPLSDLIDDLGPARSMMPVTDDHLAQMLENAPKWGGFTFDPHTGQFVEPKGYGVGMHQGTYREIKLSAKNKEQQIREAVDELLDEYREQYGHANVMIGGWVDGDNVLHLDPSEVVEDFNKARTKGALRHQQGIYDFKDVHGVKDQTIYFTRRQWLDTARGWTPEKEELFAEFINDVVWKPITSGQWSGLSGNIKRAIGTIYHHIRPWAVNGGYIPNGLRAYYDRAFLDALKEMGFAPRQTDLVSKQAVAGALIGSAEGAVYGDDKLKDALAGAAWGTVGGLALKKGLRHTYGYLPDMLARVNLALRYTFSATFDAGRYVEQNSIAAMKYGIRPTFMPKHSLRARMWKSPYVDYPVTGDEAVTHAMRLWDDLYGSGMGMWVDDTDRRAYQLGLLGFSPRHHEAYQAMELFQRGWGPQRIKAAVAEMGRYGLGRTNAEKSINFVFFPFSFSKKLLTVLGDWTIQQPGRNLLLTEGIRRYHESSLDEKWHDFVENHAPIFEQLWMINNLAFGISPGRFFLEGLADNRSKVGQAMQALGSVFIPSGAATPLAKGMGAMGDLSINAFVPLVLTGESVNRAGGLDSLDDIVRRYMPLIREVQTYAEALNEQRVAVMQGRTPWSQFQELQEEQRLIKDSYDPMAWALGYTNADGLFGSGNILGENLRGAYQDEVADLRERFPAGFQMSTEFTNTSALDQQALAELAERPKKSPAEEAILDLVEREYQLKYFMSMGKMPEDLMEQIISSQIYGIAQEWAGDKRFAELWDRFFLRNYGPIRRTA